VSPTPRARGGGSDAAQAALRASRRVLVVRTDDLGDNIIGGGFPTALNDSIDAECGYIGTPAALELLDTEGLSFVAGVDCRPGDYRDILRAGLRLRREIDRFDPDLVLLPRFDFEREALAIALAGPRPRTTITWARAATAKRARRNWWLSALRGPRLVPVAAPQHEFARLEHFARFVGVDPAKLSRGVSPEAWPWTPLPAELAEIEAPIVVIGVGAAQAKRRWPPERFASVIRELAKSGYVSALVGSPDEAVVGLEVRRHLPAGMEVVDLVGKLRIRQTAMLINQSVLYLGNDSGVGHIAAALGIPTVTVSCHPAGAPPDHVNAPERYRPVGDRAVVVRPALPAQDRCAQGCVSLEAACCIANVSVGDVLDACHGVLGSGDVVLAERDVDP
jgi:ADP-heptose:LPS heptosyltransferase